MRKLVNLNAKLNIIVSKINATIAPEFSNALCDYNYGRTKDKWIEKQVDLAHSGVTLIS